MQHIDGWLHDLASAFAEPFQCNGILLVCFASFISAALGGCVCVCVRVCVVSELRH